MKLKLLFIVMEMITLLVYPFVFLYDKLHRYSRWTVNRNKALRSSSQLWTSQKRLPSGLVNQPICTKQLTLSLVNDLPQLRGTYPIQIACFGQQSDPPL